MGKSESAEAIEVVKQTEAGEGMFAANIKIDGDDSSEDFDQEKGLEKDGNAVFELGAEEETAKFKIVAGEDSDSIFEDHLQQEAKYEDMNLNDYDDEGWGVDDYYDMNEQQPEQLPLETILEEGSVIKDSPPQPAPSKAPAKPPKQKTTKARPASAKKKLPPQPPQQQQRAKTFYQGPGARKYPEMSESERRLAESDAFLRKLNQKQAKLRGSQRSQRISEFEKELELSQMSAWTGESIFNVDAKEKETIKRKQQTILDEIYKAGMPDREELLDTIMHLRQEKNVREE